MNQPEQPLMLPLEYAAQIVFELDSMRRECSEFASRLMSQYPLNDRGLEDCARFDEALARAHGVLRQALDAIRTSQSQHRPPNT